MPIPRSFAVISSLSFCLAVAGCSQTPNYERALEDVRTEKRILEDEVKDLEAEVKDLEAELDAQIEKAADAPYESDTDNQYLDEGEWQEGLAVAQQLRRDYERDTGRPARISDMDAFVDNVSEQQDIYWSPLERSAFQDRYSAWYGRNK